MAEVKIDRRRLLTAGAATCCGLGLTAMLGAARLERRSFDCPCGYRITDLDKKWECGLKADPRILADHPELAELGRCLLRKS